MPSPQSATPRYITATTAARLTLAALLATLFLAAATAQSVSTATRVTTLAVSAPAPPVLNYQGRLADPSGNAKPDGTYSIFFALYDAQAGGNLLWSETRSVATTNGLFSLRLGEVAPFPTPTIFDGRGLWLGLTMAGDSEATPRLQVSYVAYAMYADRASSAAAATTAELAANADRLGGQPAASYAAASHQHDAAYVNDNANEVGDADVPAGGLSASKIAGTAWTSANDGAGSGLDADLLDGQSGAFYQNATNLNAGVVSPSLYSAYGDLGNEGYLGNAAGDIALNNGTKQATLNADALDGQDSSAFAASNHTHATLPIAYAFILANGKVNWGTSNVSSSWDAVNSRYVIEIKGHSYFYSEYITIVTPTCGEGWTTYTGSVSGNLLVFIANAANTKTQCNFQFVTFH